MEEQSLLLEAEQRIMTINSHRDERRREQGPGQRTPRLRVVLHKHSRLLVHEREEGSSHLSRVLVGRDVDTCVHIQEVRGTPNLCWL